MNPLVTHRAKVVDVLVEATRAINALTRPAYPNLATQISPCCGARLMSAWTAAPDSALSLKLTCGTCRRLVWTALGALSDWTVCTFLPSSSS